MSSGESHVDHALPASGRQGAAKHLPGEIGIWFFVAGDLLVFSLFFVVIAQGDREQAAVFARSRNMLDLWIGVANTLLLLTGSWFVALGVERCRGASSVVAGRYFLLAFLCGIGFVINKVVEWGGRISQGITPMTNDFFMLFFVFTGIHLFHVLLGLGILLLIRRVSARRVLGVHEMRVIESGATFWHLVDLLWIVLFALLYLV
jgi:nitric oxide reductase NorE protein